MTSLNFRQFWTLPPPNCHALVIRRKHCPHKILDRDVIYGRPINSFTAPPFVYGDAKRRRRWSEPGKNGAETTESVDGGEAPTPVEESDENEEEFVDEKLDRNEAELRKISTG